LCFFESLSWRGYSIERKLAELFDIGAEYIMAQLNDTTPQRSTGGEKKLGAKPVLLRASMKLLQ
jgi:hypothetical protein